MNASDWIEIILGAPTLLGGGGILVAKLTRIAVAIENLLEKISALTEAQAKTAEKVAEHDVRLAKGGL
jgi:hypothetical protein